MADPQGDEEVTLSLGHFYKVGEDDAVDSVTVNVNVDIGHSQSLVSNDVV